MDPKSTVPPVKAKEQNTTMAVIAYLLFFVPLLTGDAKTDLYVKYHTKQGLVLFLLVVAIRVVGWFMPLLLWLTLSWFLNLGALVLLIIGIINAVGGKQKPLPIIGRFSDMFKF